MGSIDTENINTNIGKDSNNNDAPKNLILGVDIGTTNLKCAIYDENLKALYTESAKLNILQPKDGYSEIEPSYLLGITIDFIKKCAQNMPSPSTHIIKSFGMSTQRNSIILWNKKTGENYTKLILWNDKRPLELCNSLNKGVFLNLLKIGSKCLSIAGTSIAGHRLNAFSHYKVETNHTSAKLISQLKILENKLVPEDFKNVLYGTLDTWLLWNLTKEKIHATDITCASTSGMYDMFQNCWSKLLSVALSFPMSLLPKVYDTCHEFGNLKPEILNLGYDIPITAAIGDAQSSFIGECATQKGDVVITIGTGSFLSANVGEKPLSSNYGIFPLVAYKNLDEKIFILHASISSAGIAIEWAKSIGLYSDYKEFNNILNLTPNSRGVYFISAFGLMDAENFDKSKVGTGFIGIKANTTKAEMLRAIVDSIVFPIKLKFESLIKDLKENGIELGSIKICGGVSQSNFICQYMSNLLDHPIERGESCSSTSMYGAAFLAGIGSHIWKNTHDLIKFRKNVTIFKPNKTSENNINNFYNKNEISDWTNALKRFCDWH